MTILADHEINALANKGMVQNYKIDLINPASLDLRLGNRVMLESVTSHQMIPLDITTQEEKIIFKEITELSSEQLIALLAEAQAIVSKK